MALPMPRPFRHKSGVYYLNVRLPSDAAPKLRGVTVLIPIGDATVSAKLTDKAFISLRTKDPGTAKTRFGAAFEALSRQLDALRSGPRSLPYKQVVALAGQVYRDRVARDEAHPDLGPEHLAGQVKAWADVIRELRETQDPVDALENGPFEADPLAQVVAAHAEGEQAGAWVDAALLCEPDFELRKARGLYGREVDEVLAAHALVVDDATRVALLREVANAAEDAARQSVRTMRGDFSPDPASSRFPTFRPVAAPAPAPPKRRERLGVAELFERWSAANQNHKAASTLRRYGPSLASLARFTDGIDVRAVTDEHLWKWAEHRRDVDGIAARTVNRNDLVAASSVLAWATTRDGGKLRPDNPAESVRLQVPKVQTTRPPTFYAHEVRAILLAARAVESNPRHPRASAGRRWVPWICAYTGARVQEVHWLGKEDVWNEGGIWILRFPNTKDGNARLVPIHEELEREGLLEFVAAAPAKGFFFAGDQPQKSGSTRTQPEQRASELAEWVRKRASLPREVCPNHGWRHTWCTLAEEAGVPKRFSNAISGHNKNRDVSDGYVTPSVRQLHAEMVKFPRFDLTLTAPRA